MTIWNLYKTITFFNEEFAKLLQVLLQARKADKIVNTRHNWSKNALGWLLTIVVFVYKSTLQSVGKSACGGTSW